jgi:5-methylcytosine-specific restriction endonuclease McrA
MNGFTKYRERDQLLAGMGFTSYKAYLTSPLWASIRFAVLMRDDHICRACGKKSWQVHHRRYSLEALQGTDLTKLESICAGCHKRIEFHYSKKLPLNKANSKLTKKVRKSAKNKAWIAEPRYRELLAQKKRLLAQRPQPNSEISAVCREIRQIIKAFSARTAGSSARPHTPPTTQLCSRGTIPRVGDPRV